MVRPIGNIKIWWRHRHSHVRVAKRSRSVTAGQPPWIRELARVGVPAHVLIPSTTLAGMLTQTVRRYHSAPALIYHGQVTTYQQLLDQVHRTAAGLASLGVGRGDRVLLTLPNCPEFVTTFFAVQKLGAVVVNAGPLIGPDDLVSIASRCSPVLIVGLDLQAQMLDQVAGQASVGIVLHASLESYQPLLMQMGYRFKRWQRGGGNADQPRHVRMDELLESAASRPPTIEPDPEDVAILQPTGGTTAAPKLAQLTHHSLLANAAQISALMDIRQAPERFLGILPMFHVYGLTTCLTTPILHGAAIIPVTRFKPADLLEVMERDRPTIAPLVPLIMERLCDELQRQRHRRRFDELRACISGAAPLPWHVAERFERLTGVPVYQGYGLTEASPVTHATPIGCARAGSIGLPLPDTKVRIGDLSDPAHDARPDEPGELLVSGPQIMKGYYRDAEQTAAALFTDEAGTTWLRTGDVVRADKDGYFYVLDRQGDTINHAGFKIYPAKVERVLEQHPQVLQAAVVGRQDDAQTEVVVAVIKLKHEVKDVQSLTGHLKDLCREHLAAYEVPARIELADELPFTPLGKLLRRNLRQSSGAMLPVDQAVSQPISTSTPDGNGRADQSEVDQTKEGGQR